MGRQLYYDYTDDGFTKISKELEKLGCKNNKFMLGIYNKDLIDIDPYSYNLSLEQKMEIILECIRNPWYFFRKVVRIPVQGGITKYGLKVNRATLLQNYCNINNINYIVHAPRTQGIELTALMNELYNYIFGYSIHIQLSSRKVEDCKLQIYRFKELFKNLPDYMYNLNINSNIYVDNVLGFSHNNNTIEGKNYYDDMNNQIILFEPCLSKCSKEILDNYKKSHFSLQVVMDYVPQELNDNGLYMYNFIQNAIQIDDIKLYDYPKKSLNKIKNIRGIIYAPFSYKTLNNSEDWFEEMCRCMNNDYKSIRSELLMQWGREYTMNFEKEDKDAQ